MSVAAAAAAADGASASGTTADGGSGVGCGEDEEDAAKRARASGGTEDDDDDSDDLVSRLEFPPLHGDPFDAASITSSVTSPHRRRSATPGSSHAAADAESDGDDEVDHARS